MWTCLKPNHNYLERLKKLKTSSPLYLKCEQKKIDLPPPPPQKKKNISLWSQSNWEKTNFFRAKFFFFWSFFWPFFLQIWKEKNLKVGLRLTAAAFDLRGKEIEKWNRVLNYKIETIREWQLSGRAHAPWLTSRGFESRLFPLICTLLNGPLHVGNTSSHSNSEPR